MNFELTEEQKLMKNAAREFMEREISPIADEYDRKYQPLTKDVLLQLFRKLRPLGYVGGLAPQEWGGDGLSLISYGVLLEELARAYGSLSLAEMVHHVAGMYQIAVDGDEGQRAKFLRATTSGDMMGCYCLTEPDVGSGAQAIATSAVPDGNGYVINGTKTWITNGEVADVAIVVAVVIAAKGKKEFSRFLVERKVSPFAARELPKMGFASCPTSEVVFDNCHVPKEALFGPPGEGYHRTMIVFQCFRGYLATIAVGLAQAATDAAVDYARDRKQFGRPIGKFQTIQNMIAEMAIETDAARLLTFRALELLDKGISCFKESSMAKAYATTIATDVTSKGIEIHGAYGISEEYPLERYFRDARTVQIPDGTTEIQKLIVAREVLGLKGFA